MIAHYTYFLCYSDIFQLMLLRQLLGIWMLTLVISHSIVPQYWHNVHAPLLYIPSPSLLEKYSRKLLLTH